MIEEQMNNGYTLVAVEEHTTPTKEIEIIDDDAFSYEGFQVVRGEFFAHIYEPSFTFNGNKVSVNTACIKKTTWNRICTNTRKSGRKETGSKALYRRRKGLLPLVYS